MSAIPAPSSNDKGPATSVSTDSGAVQPNLQERSGEPSTDPQVTTTQKKTSAYANWSAYLGDDGAPANDALSIDPHSAPRFFAQVIHRETPTLFMTTDVNLIKTKYQIDTVSDILQASMAERANRRFKEIYIDGGGERGEKTVSRWMAPEGAKALWEANAPLLCLPKAALRA